MNYSHTNRYFITEVPVIQSYFLKRRHLPLEKHYPGKEIKKNCPFRQFPYLARPAEIESTTF